MLTILKPKSNILSTTNVIQNKLPKRTKIKIGERLCGEREREKTRENLFNKTHIKVATEKL